MPSGNSSSLSLQDIRNRKVPSDLSSPKSYAVIFDAGSSEGDFSTETLTFQKLSFPIQAVKASTESSFIWVWRLGLNGLIGFVKFRGLNGLGLETWLVWIDWVWGSKLFLSLDLNSLSLNLGVNRPLLPVVVRFTISSFPELADLFGSRENEVKVWIFDYIFFSTSKLV
uniref:Uncharacterized protein n=1 Tax=Fagus sylvatica TaxID=28930 RepID=A0A2N9GRN3_FAGSY